jgi:AAA family ATP:ADP antiporter
VSGAARALKIQPGEARLAVSMIALSFLVMSGQAIGQSGVTGLVLARIGTDALPVLYLLQGAAAIALMLVMASILGRVDQRRAYLFMAAALVVVVVVERIALAADPAWIYWVLWVTVTIAILVQTVFLWGIAGTVTDTRQAKRLFPLFAAGGILGSVIGGLLTAPLARIIGTPNTMIVWVATLVGAYALAWLVLRGRERRPSSVAKSRASALRDLAAVFRYVSTSRLLVWMTIASVLFSVLFFSLFLPWASAAADRFPHADDLAGFIGLFSAVTTAAAFLVSSLATNRLFTRVGIATAVLILPVLYVGAFGVLLVTASFATLVAARAVTGIWLQGVASPGWETLTNVVPETRRDQVRAFLNGGPSQAGTAIAGLIALVGTDVLSPRQLTIVGLAAAVGTVYVTWRCKRAYASALVEALQAGRPVFSGAATLTVPFALAPDAQALGSAIEATADPSASVRRLAVGLVGDLREERVQTVLERALRDEDAVVAATAAAFLSSRSKDPGLEARLRTFVADPSPAVRAGAVACLEHAPATIAEPLAVVALQDDEPSVRASAVRTLAIAAPARALEAIERSIEDPSPRVRHASAEAGARIGAPALRPMLAALTRPAARDAALEALAQLPPFDGADEVRTFATKRAVEAIQDREIADAIVDHGEPADLLREALLDRGRRRGREALRAMSLLSADGASVRAAIDQLDERTGGQIATALEMLESTGERALVRPMLALWDRAELHARAAPGGDPLRALIDDPDPFIAMCAELLHVTSEGGSDMARVHATMPIMERVLFLRKVPLFQELAPADLMPIAEVADEQAFVAGDLLGDEGEMGDGLHVIVTGTVRVEAGGTEIARRGTGDVVGEMSLITMHPRMASLHADGEVRTIWISRRAFEGMLHDRPDIAIGVMQVLALRLAER